jgi:hypothetical protein
MTRWHKDGRPIGDEELADLALVDTDTLCEYAGTTFRFTAETVTRHSPPGTGPSGGTAVLALRELGPGDRDRAIYLVDFADACRLDAVGCEGERRTCAEARETACRAARRYVGVELFHRAQEMIDPGQAA